MSRTDLHLAQSAIRCPFCHGDIQVAARDWVMCRTCAARHHEGCWDERGACSACGERAHLVDAVPRSYGLEILRLETELARAEREWAALAGQLGARASSGQLVAPSREEAVVWFVFAGIALLVTVSVLAAGAPGSACVVPFCLTVLFAAAGFATLGRAANYGEHAARHARRRQALLEEIETVKLLRSS